MYATGEVHVGSPFQLLLEVLLVDLEVHLIILQRLLNLVMVGCSNIFSQLVDGLLNSEYVRLQLILIILEHPHERFLNQTGIHDTELVQ